MCCDDSEGLEVIVEEPGWGIKEERKRRSYKIER